MLHLNLVSSRLPLLAFGPTGNSRSTKFWGGRICWVAAEENFLADKWRWGSQGALSPHRQKGSKSDWFLLENCDLAHPVGPLMMTPAPTRAMDGKECEKPFISLHFESNFRSSWIFMLLSPKLYPFWSDHPIFFTLSIPYASRGAQSYPILEKARWNERDC